MKKWYAVLLLLCTAGLATANNVKIQNISIINNGPGDIKVKFDLSWDNSWRVNTGQNNYDGVWVFFKYRPKGTTDAWGTATVALTSDILPAGCSVSKPFSGPTSGSYTTGAMIYRSELGAGPVSFTGIQLALSPTLPYNIDVQGFAIEMVYIPQAGSLYLGDGNGTNESTYAFHGGNSPVNDNVGTFTNGGFDMPFHTDINNFDDDYLNWQNGKQLKVGPSGVTEVSGGIETKRPAFPVFSAMWCMKYEISQGAWRDFLNCLSVSQQTNHIAVAPTAARGTLAMVASGTPVRTNIKIDVPANGNIPAVFGCDENGNGTYNETGDGEYVACGYLIWPDVAAYLAWSGLSPMTEIAYERICRGHTSAGPNTAVYGEYAWGTNGIFSAPTTLTNAGSPNETASNQVVSATNGYGNTASNTPGYPVRNGMYAAHISADRVVSGAAFFGVMEMSGNVDEVCVTIGNNQGRLFNGSNGDGYLTADGYAYMYSWPGSNADPNATGITDAPNKFTAGTMVRGGSYAASNGAARISDRMGGVAVSRQPWNGGRGVIYLY